MKPKKAKSGKKANKVNKKRENASWAKGALRHVRNDKISLRITPKKKP